jgi:transcriptional regulator with XRE-family HTH domain
LDGGLLRRWRLEADLTQRALAERLGKPYSYVWKVEAAERRINPIEFIGLVPRLRCSPCYRC